MKTASVIQSNYIPWIGYFAMINDSDLFVLYEDVQYTKNDWRNRNRILLNDHYTWLTIPVRHKCLTQRFTEIEIVDAKWASKHFETLRHKFSNEKNWNNISEEIFDLYKQASKHQKLCDINRLFFKWILQKLNIKTEILYLDKYPEFENPSERLLSILSDYKVSEYISGPAGKSYLNHEDFNNKGMNLHYYDYTKMLKKYNLYERQGVHASILQLIIKGDFHGFND